mmetsp:Transcript_28957/g.92327  ORF Transcript_28957/g.92327 Transcript_28957/m.92327 type:complete len:420 (+) Transcript_28957:78-1337(+)
MVGARVVKPGYLAVTGAADVAASTLEDLGDEATRAPCRTSPAKVAVALAGMLLVSTAMAVLRIASPPRQLRSRVASTEGLFEQKGQLACGSVEQNVRYWTRQDYLSRIEGVAGSGACRMKCFAEPRCMAWTWAPTYKGSANVCFLRGLEQDELPIRHHEPGAVSGGLPCNMDKMVPAVTLYCFALTIPNSYEQSLLAMQASRRTSLFGCDEYAIFSNTSITIAQGIQTHVVKTSLECKFGGEFGTALNLDIFKAVWAEVVREQRYNFHEWTVKVDPDCVFFPYRLRSLLPHHPEAQEGVYLNNCKFGMHGPIEVFSRSAVYSWALGKAKCSAHFFALCKADCGWGEDMFIDQCLMKVLKARRDNEWALLAEDHCAANPLTQTAWTPQMCRSNHAAFHPFKDQRTYLACMANSNNGALFQ